MTKQTDLLERLKAQVQQGKKPTLSKSEVRQLVLAMKSTNPPVYEKIKDLKVSDQRKLFIAPLLNALGLGSVASFLGPLGTSAVGVGAVAAAGLAGAALGRVAQNNEITRLKQEKFKIDGTLMMARNQRDNERGKLEYKLGELENQLSDLNDASDSGVNLLNLWVDSHSLI